MPAPKNIKRRSFVRSLGLLLLLSRCKKDSLTTPKNLSQTQTLSSIPPVAVTDDYLGQYTITEIGTALSADPTFNQSTITGYTDQVSYLPGDTVNVYLSGPPNASSVVSLLNTKRTAILSVTTPIVTQPIKSAKPWVDGFMYDKTFSFKIPEYFASGIYTWMGTIPFVCKAPNPTVDITVVYPSNTLNAYNFAGGKSLYAPDFYNRATVLSFLRSNTIDYGEFYKWLDSYSYNINYICDSDLDDINQIKDSKVVIITGHSEYWTKQARENIDTFIASGKNVLMLSGNSMWWQVRYNKSNNSMICYKDVDGSDKKYNTVDPLGNTVYSTVNWGTSAVNYPIVSSLGADYRGGGYGNTMNNRWNGYKIVSPKSPLLKGTGLKSGDILNMPTREYDSAPIVSLFAPGSSKIPQIDNKVLNFYKSELIGFDFAQNLIRKDQLGFGTFMIAKRTASSGTIVNAATMDWCTNIYLKNGMVKTITKNMIDLSLAGTSLFTDTNV